MDNNQSSWVKISFSFTGVPIELTIFAFFTFIVAILSYILLIFKLNPVDELITPITGWGPGLSYTGIWLLVFALIFVRGKIHTPIFKRQLRFMIIAMLAITMFRSILLLIYWQGGHSGVRQNSLLCNILIICNKVT